ncbi:MAG: amino acid adenylation domain-containing protein [Betaproteobacteria bacterium]
MSAMRERSSSDTDTVDAAETPALELSSSQRRVWFLDRVDPGRYAYHEPGLWRIDGPLDAAALHAALEAVAVHQPMLRTRFPSENGVPRQCVEPAARVAFERVEPPPGERDIERWLAADVIERSKRPFDLAAAPPIRWTLYALGPGSHALLRVWHHILGDGYSAGVLNVGIALAYEAVRAGRSPDLPPLDVDYHDFTRREARERTGPRADADLAYWKVRLADAPVLDLAGDFRRPALQDFEGGLVTVPFDSGLFDAARSFAKRMDTSAHVAFMTAYASLLSRLSGDTDVVVGMPVGNRDAPGYARVVGFFADTLACRVDLAGAPSVGDALRRVHTRMWEGVGRRSVPLDTLVDTLGVSRDPSRNPLFQAAFGIYRTEYSDLPLAGLAARHVRVPLGRARFDLTLLLLQGADDIVASWEYASSLFERATIERMARQYRVLVEAMVRDPAATLAALPLMGDAERDRIVDASRGRITPGPAERTVHARFAAQVAATPGAPAIDTLAYAELDTRANRLAAELRDRGVAKGAFVAVARRRPVDIAIAWLAVLKAGAAYLPIDLELPDARIAGMLDDAQVAFAIVDDVPASRFIRPGLDVVCPERDAASIAARAPAPLADAAAPDDPAYMIYTSGSTGRPKGVVVAHRSVTNLVCDTDYVSIGPGDALAQLANPAFDASTFEFWGALLNGARIVPIDKATAVAPRGLAAAIRDRGVSVMFLTTALFDAVAREAPDAFRPCATVLFGGETVSPRAVAAVLRAGPPRRLVHVYGPTETTTFATWHLVEAVGDDAATVPIGRAIANAEVFVLRPDGEPAAPGEKGEIAIGGAGVALCPVGASDADRKRFVERAVGRLPARRLYLTGDQARLRDDGAIVFAGRADAQVKVRGHRIELSEIESALADLPGVREAIAVVRGDTSDTRRIVAYVVPSDPGVAPPDGILRALRRTLPPTMLPAEIAWLPALPLNASGKIDRRALPRVGALERARPGVRVAPRGSLEAAIALLWQRLLDVEVVDVHDHFFEIGGHSLLAARFVDAFEQDTGIRVPITTLFSHDTVEGLAHRITLGITEGEVPVLALREEGSRPPIVYLHGDFWGGGFHSRQIAQALGPDQPFYIVQPHGLGGTAMPTSIEAMATERLEALRVLRPRGPYVIGGHCNGAFIAFEMARLLVEAGETVLAVVIVEAFAPRDGSGGAFDEYVETAGPALATDAPGSRLQDLMQRFYAAMRSYRAPRVDAHLALILSQESDAPALVAAWARLASSIEHHVLPGNHVTLVLKEGGGTFAALLKQVIDRAIERQAR